MAQTLHEKLSRQFGDGLYLTNSMLDYSDAITFDPTAEYDPALSAQFANASNPIEIDGILDEAKFNFGQPGRSVWSTPSENLDFGDDYDGIFLFGAIIKQAGETTYRVPRVLEPFVPELKRQAEHQFAHSAYAADKIAGITIRRLPLVDGKKQLSEGHWHTHNPFTREMVERGYYMYEMTPEILEAIEDVSPNLIQTEYIVSNMCASRIQTKPFEEAQPFKQHTNFRLVTEEPESRQADNYEVVMGNSYMYHTAATVPAELVGETRVLAITSHMPTIEMEQHFE